MSCASFRQRLVVFIFILTGLLPALVACGGQVDPEPAPPVIHYGEDLCEFCGMIISDERYAAGYLTRDGAEHIFDDLGGMFRSHLQTQDAAQVAAFFVHDYEDVTWIRAETAHYVLSQDLPTPMLSGLVACDTAEKAQALAAEVNGRVLTFEDVLAYYQEQLAVAAEHDAHHHPQTNH